MNYTPEFLWKNFKLGTELQISGSFIYNALESFDQMEHFCNDEEIFEFLYNTSVGFERLEKIAVVLLEHNPIDNQEEFEKSLITHSHSNLLNRIKNNNKLHLDKVHNKFVQLLDKFYKSMRYNRFNLSSVYDPNQEKPELIKLIEKELGIEIKTDALFPTPNDDRIKKFVGNVIGKIVKQLYDIIADKSRDLNMYTYEIRFNSKAFKIFIRNEFTFEIEHLSRKEILIHLLNTKENDKFIDFISSIEPILLDKGITHEYVKCLLKPHKIIDVLDEIEAIYEDGFDKERLESVKLISDEGVFFEEDGETF